MKYLVVIILIAILSTSCSSQEPLKEKDYLPYSQTEKLIKPDQRSVDFKISYIRKTDKIIINDKDSTNLENLEYFLLKYVVQNKIPLYKRFNAHLYIDRNTSMNIIDNIKFKLTKMGFKILYYITNTNPKKGIYTISPYLISEAYTNQNLNLNKERIYSIENSKTKKNLALTPPPPPLASVLVKESLFNDSIVSDYNFIWISFDNLGNVLINEREVENFKEELVLKMIDTEYFIILKNNGLIDYQTYINTLDEIELTIFNLRENFSKEKFNKSYFSLEKSEKKIVHQKVPYNFIELLLKEVMKLNEILNGQ